MLATYRFGARGNMGPVTVYWYDGGLRPPTPLGIDPDDPMQRLGEGENGILFIGEKGIITCAGWSGMPRLLPLELHREYKRPAEDPPARRGTPRRLAPGVQGRNAGEQQLRVRRAALRVRPCSATWPSARGSSSKWDGPNMKATNAPEADQYLTEHPTGRAGSCPSEACCDHRLRSPARRSGRSERGCRIDSIARSWAVLPPDKTPQRDCARDRARWDR